MVWIFLFFPNHVSFSRPGCSFDKLALRYTRIFSPLHLKRKAVLTINRLFDFIAGFLTYWSLLRHLCKLHLASGCWCCGKKVFVQRVPGSGRGWDTSELRPCFWVGGFNLFTTSWKVQPIAVFRLNLMKVCSIEGVLCQWSFAALTWNPCNPRSSQKERIWFPWQEMEGGNHNFEDTALR